MFDPWVGKIPWRRKWQPTPGLLPGKPHGLRILVGYSPWGRKESDTTERLHFTSLHFTSQVGLGESPGARLPSGGAEILAEGTGRKHPA